MLDIEAFLSSLSEKENEKCKSPIKKGQEKQFELNEFSSGSKKRKNEEKTPKCEKKKAANKSLDSPIAERKRVKKEEDEQREYTQEISEKIEDEKPAKIEEEKEI